MIKVITTKKITTYYDEENIADYIDELMNNVGYDENGLDGIEAFKYYLAETYDYDEIGTIEEKEENEMVISKEDEEKIVEMIKKAKEYWSKKWED